MLNVLVLDANQRSGLAAIRSLGNIDGVLVYAADSEREAIGGSSKYCQSYLQHPSITECPKDFLHWLKHTLIAHKFDIVFPMTEVSSQLLLMNTELLGSTKLPFASYDKVMSLANKGNLTKLAESIDVPVPQSTFYPNSSEVNLESINDYPVVIKPCLSKIWDGHNWLDTVVQVAHDKAELEKYLNTSPWLSQYEFMLQAFIPGYGAGAFAIYNQGSPLAFFGHQRLREKPPQGGVSVLSKSVELDPQLLNSAKKLLDAAQWHGVAMVEFRVAEDGTAYLMEVNTRFWGSLQLAIDAGVDFPKLLYQITVGEPVSEVRHYKKEVKLRWLLGDIDSLYLVLKSSQYSKKEKFKRILDFCIPDFFSTHHQVARWGDFKPGLTELKQYLHNLKS